MSNPIEKVDMSMICQQETAREMNPLEYMKSLLKRFEVSVYTYYCWKHCNCHQCIHYTDHDTCMLGIKEDHDGEGN